ncbi:MAG: PD-(D/E)XK nuclease family protein [Firmicutes bacterium]|nr:PD-(D/E)XK nuclease family protein [Bacillota bacterium]
MNKQEQLNYLKNSLMYQMSLGSKELYHSNVWAWLLEKDREYIKAFFNIDLTEFDNKFEVRRELAHRDITIWLHKKGYPDNQGKCYLVIENKIKSLPTKEQLQDYTEDLGNNELFAATYTGIRSVLNSEDRICKNKKTNEVITWNFRSYKDIAESIVKITNDSDISAIKEHKSQILEYCHIVQALNDLLESSLDDTKNILSYKTMENLEDERIRIGDVFKKLKGADFLAYVRKRKNELDQLCPKSEGYRLAIWQSYNNKHATLDIRFSNWTENCSSYFDIGIQIEESQYRRMALVDGQTARKFNSSNTAENFFMSLAEEWFDKNFDPKSTQRTIWGKATKLKKKFDSYITNQYCFVYQYCNIAEQNSNIRYEDLFNCLKEDLKKAKEIIEKRAFN